MSKYKRNHDFEDIIKYDIKKKDPSELKYEEYMRNKNLKIYGKVIHQTSDNNGQNHKVKIITQISSSSTDCNTTKRSDELRRNESSSSSDYIKRQTIIHNTKSKSLDGDHGYKCHNTEIEVVIGNNEMPYETVVKANINHGTGSSSDESNHLNSQTSYVRPVIQSCHSIHSLPSRVSNHVKSLTDTTNYDMKSSSATSRRLKKLRKALKIGGKKDYSQTTITSTTEKEIDELARSHVGKLSSPAGSTHFTSESKSSFNIFSHHNVPFNSHQIGGSGGSRLPPIRKGKKTKSQYGLFSFLKPISSNVKGSLSNTTTSSHINIVHNRQSSPSHTQRFSTDSNVMMETKPGCIVAVITDEDGKEQFSYETHNDDIDFIDDDINQDGYSTKVLFQSEQHDTLPTAIDCDDGNNYSVIQEQKVYTRKTSVSRVEIPISEQRFRRASCPSNMNSCHCDDQRLELISKILVGVIVKSNPDALSAKLKQYNNELKHFIECPLISRFSNSNNNNNSRLRSSTRSRGISENESSMKSTNSSCSLYNSLETSQCNICTNTPDQHLCEEWSEILPNVLNELEGTDEICLLSDHLRYFQQAKCYQHYETGLMNAVGTECTLENVALLHYITRNVIKFIGGNSSIDMENQNDTLCGRRRRRKGIHVDDGGGGDDNGIEDFSDIGGDTSTTYNVQIQRNMARVLDYTGQYYNKHYLPFIQDKYGNLNEFILHHLEKNDEEVD